MRVKTVHWCGYRLVQVISADAWRAWRAYEDDTYCEEYADTLEELCDKLKERVTDEYNYAQERFVQIVNAETPDEPA